MAVNFNDNIVKGIYPKNLYDHIVADNKLVSGTVDSMISGKNSEKPGIRKKVEFPEIFSGKKKGGKVRKFQVFYVEVSRTQSELSGDSTFYFKITQPQDNGTSFMNKLPRTTLNTLC